MSRKHGPFERSQIFDFLNNHNKSSKAESSTKHASASEDPNPPIMLLPTPCTPKASNFNLKRCLDAADKAQSVPHLYSSQQHMSPCCVSNITEDVARMSLIAGASPLSSPLSSPPTSPRGSKPPSPSTKRSPHLKRASPRRLPMIPHLVLRRPERSSVMVDSTSSPQLQLNQTPGHATMAGDLTATKWGVENHETH